MDVLIRNGRLVDPDDVARASGDIAIRDGRFVAVSEISQETAQVIDVAGSYVAPGFIDMHVHVYEDGAVIGIDADRVGVQQGVTTIVDAGSTGSDGLARFRETIIDTHDTEVLAFLNISRKGLCEGLSELADPADLMSVDEGRAAFAAESNLVGLKARMSGSVVREQDVKPLVHARMVADALDVPIMIHIGNPPPYLPDILPLLKKGDIVTHAFHGKKHGILDSSGEMIPEARDALTRGVLFDIGHGSASFSYETLQKFKGKYDEAFTTSTDIYERNIETPVGSLMTTMTKLLQLGYSLDEVVASVTSRARAALGLHEQGTFAVGTVADVTVFDVIDRKMALVDSNGEVRETAKVIEPKMTIKSGRVVWKA